MSAQLNFPTNDADLLRFDSMSFSWMLQSHNYYDLLVVELFQNEYEPIENSSKTLFPVVFFLSS